jgi:predicted SAM-dependent methyltransferase
MSRKSVPQLLLEEYRRFGGVPHAAALGGPPRLHIGCGQNALPGWLNTDYSPGAAGVAALDATRPFPFPDGVFGCIYSEHMIEHIHYASGVLMLGECFRTLAPGGRLRIVTPDLDFLVGLYREPDKPLHRDYIRWANERFYPNATADDAVFVVNNFVRDWGHVFIYDRATLERTLREIGFTGVRRVTLNGSDRPELRGLANESRMPPGFLDLESMVIEADRPDDAVPAWLQQVPRATAAPPAPEATPAGDVAPTPVPASAPAGLLRSVYRALRPVPVVGPALALLKRALLGQ